MNANYYNRLITRTAADEFDGPDSPEEALGNNFKMERAIVSDLNKLAGIARGVETDVDPDKMDVIKGNDLCAIDIGGTNLFCGGNIGQPRGKMPQIPKEHVQEFFQFLKENNVSLTEEEVFAAHLKPSQMDLDVGKTARIMGGLEKGQELRPIFISDDNYVLDGHHRWSGKVALQIAAGRKNEIKMPVMRIGLPIQEAIDAANKFDQKEGIEKEEGIIKTEPEPENQEQRQAYMSQIIVTAGMVESLKKMWPKIKKAWPNVEKDFKRDNTKLINFLHEKMGWSKENIKLAMEKVIESIGAVAIDTVTEVPHTGRMIEKKFEKQIKEEEHRLGF